MCRASLIDRLLSAGSLLSCIALVIPLAAVSPAGGADVGISSGASAPGQDSEKSTGPPQRLPQENSAKQPLFDPIEERIKYLHDRLRITPAQEPLWDNVGQVMRENARAVAPLIKERFQSAQSGTAIDNLGSYEKLGEAQLDGLKKFITAFQALYDSLSGDQKKIADSVFRLGPLSMVGGIPALPEALVTPAPYRYYQSYPIFPAYPSYPPYPSNLHYPFYSYYPYYRPWIWGPPVGASFFFIHRHHHHHPFRPPSPTGHVGVPSARGGAMHRR